MSDRHRPFFIDLFAIGGLSKKKLDPLTTRSRPATMGLRADRASAMRTARIDKRFVMSQTAVILHYGK